MHSGLVTFDFHNTLVRCDAWFDLEVRMLPGRVLDLLEYSNVLARGSVDPIRLESAYRTLRAEIIEHGRELDAVAGTIEAFARVGKSLEPSAIRDHVDSLFRSLVPDSVLVDGANETVSWLAHHGIRVAVISSAVHHDFLEWSLTHHGIRDHLTLINTSASTGYYKSNPEIYRRTFAELGVRPDRVLHVGDSYRFDHIAGLAAGARTVWLNEGGIPVPESTTPPARELSTLLGAGPILQAMLCHETESIDAN